MRTRFGLVVGFGAGYYLGAKAGRERYEELNDLLGKVRRSEAYGTATEKAKAVADLGFERARDAVEDLRDGEWAPAGDGAAPPATSSTLS